ncbi:MAG: hypothetical protein NTX72_00490 [Candidatus Uhrbacteria bacterium]|nr:hypothetical protein [Candidatus Uhrbacteria bacterium]
MDVTYNYPAKNTVRSAWMEFLPDTFVQSDSGLYLPGHENLELAAYLEKGLVPKQMVGVEQDPLLIDHVRENAQGTLIVHGNVTSAVQYIEQTQTTNLRFANLDLSNSYRDSIEQILSLFRVFPSSQGGYLAVTSYSARDNETLTEGVINTSKFFSVVKSQEQFFGPYGQMLNRYRAMHGTWNRSEKNKHTHLTRTLGFLWWIGLVLGSVRKARTGRYVIDELYLSQIKSEIDAISEEARLLVEGDRNFHLVRNKSLGKLFAKRRSELVPTRLQQFIHLSRRSQPMQTWMLHIAPMTGAQKPTHQEVIGDLWQLMTHGTLVMVDESGTRVTTT